MSHLIARIMMAILMIPLGCVIYFASFRLSDRWITLGGYPSYREALQFRHIFSGIIAWTFVGAWWYLLWSRSVRWTITRLIVSLACIPLSAMTAFCLAIWINETERSLGDFIGSAIAPLLWLVSTTFVWRESAVERAARVDRSVRDSVVCPTCGYNLTGLKEARCPECGAQFTLDQLLAEQPGRTQAEIEA